MVKQIVKSSAKVVKSVGPVVFHHKENLFGHCHIQRRLASRFINLRATAIKLVFSDLYKACSFRNPSVYTRY